MLRQPDLLALLVLVLAVAALFAPVWLTGRGLVWPVNNPTESDVMYRHWPDMLAYADSLRAGRIALWDDSVALGRPLPGDTATLFLYPGVGLFLLLPPTMAFNLFYALHVFMAGGLAYGLMRWGYGVRPGAALVTGLLYALMPKLIAHMAAGHMGVMAAVALAPGVVLGLKLALDGRGLLPAALGGLALALALPTHIQVPYYTGALGAVMVAWQGVAVAWNRDWRGVGRLGAIFGVFLISFALVGMAVWLPLAEILPYNSRSVFTVTEAGAGGLPLLFSIHALLGLDLAMQTAVFGSEAVVYHEWVVGLGTLTLPLGGLGLLASRERDRWLWGALVGFAAVFMLGNATPVFGLLFATVPGFDLLREPVRMWFLGGLGAAVLAGMGIDRLLAEDGWREQQRLRRMVGGMVLVLALVYGGLLAMNGLVAGINWLLVAKIVVLSGMGALFLRQQAAPVALLIVLLLIDVLPQSGAFIEGRRPADVFLQESAVVSFLQAQPEELHRVYSDRWLQVEAAKFAEAGIETLEGGLAFQIGHAAALIRAATGCDETTYQTAMPPCQYTQYPLGTPDAEALGKLNVAYVASATELTGADFEKVFEGDGLNVYANRAVRSRAWIETAADDWVAVAVLDHRDGYYELGVEVDRPGMMVLAHPWMPGWQAWVDGERTTVEFVEGGLVGVPVPAGETAVTVRYLPQAWQMGWPVAVISVVAIVIWAGVALVRQTRRTEPVSKNEGKE